jgi:hypothetical protein
MRIRRFIEKPPPEKAPSNFANAGIYFLSPEVRKIVQSEEVKKIIEERILPEIIHAHVFTAGLPALILGRLYGIPIVLTEHWTKFPRRKLNPFEKILAKLVMNRVDMILPVSKNLELTLCSYGIKGRFKKLNGFPKLIDAQFSFKQYKNRNKNTTIFCLVCFHK